jgi:D-lactate dehydrogenase
LPFVFLLLLWNFCLQEMNYLEKSPAYFARKLAKILPSNQIQARAIDRYARAGDASFYYLVPKCVVFPKNLTDIQSLFQFSQQEKIPLTFRAAGTSLSGQAISDGILVDISRHFRGIFLEKNGHQIRVEPGVIGGYANAILKKFGTKIGPDPASISAAMMGGILANNSSGMCCGVAQNAYHTLRSLKMVLPNGQIFSTENPQDFIDFEQNCPEIAQKLTELRNQALKNAPLTARIRQKYRQKNTVGYGINALLDFERPLDILAHLMIGSEGTLGFIAEATLETVPDFPEKMTGLLPFSSAKMACEIVEKLAATGARAIELMDWNSIRAIRDLEDAPDFLRKMPEGAALLLTEFQEKNFEELQTVFERAKPVLAEIRDVNFDPNFSEFHQNPAEQARLWKLRKGLYPSVANLRKTGATVLLEDLTFPVTRLGEAVEDLQDLMLRHGFPDGIVMGHAKDGNLHFIVSQPIETPREVADYGLLMAEMTDLVLKKYDGALKGEHGTGRNMAPFVEAEWGAEATEIMREIKRALDPDCLLNPGVIINDDPEAHLKNLKKMPTVEAEVDKCVECGFCENRCPSRDLTMTPRQRIQIRRAISTMKSSTQTADYQQLITDFNYAALDTCATDGLCAIDCPVAINTGDLVKKLRAENHSPRQNKWANWAAQHTIFIEKNARRLVRFGVFFENVFGKKTLVNLTRNLRKIIPAMPIWMPPTPHFLEKKSKMESVFYFSQQKKWSGKSIYFPACVTRMMATDSQNYLISIAQKIDYQLVIPENIIGTCCGQAFSSKGFSESSRSVFNETIEKIWVWTENGTLPVVLDATSCSQTLQTCRPNLSPENQAKFDQITILDSIEWLEKVALPRLKIFQKKKKIVLHPVCSLQKMKLDGAFLRIAEACADEVFVPKKAGCCGMAGDRGFFFPELTDAATRLEAAEVREFGAADGYFSSACTCEMALSAATSADYFSISKLVDEVS